MEQPWIPVGAPLRAIEPILDEILLRIGDVVKSGRWIHGHEVSAFERSFSGFCSMPHCLAVGNGTDGLELALRVVDARDREVVTTANAGGYTTTACRLVGAVPVYVDITPDRLVMDPEAAIAAITDRTRAIVATHLYGNVAEVEAIRAGLRRIGRDDIIVIEDASQAHGATTAGRRVGGLGDLSVFSFYPTKNLGALGDAGAVLSRSKEIHDRLDALHQYGWTSRYASTVPLGRNSRMDEIQASVLNLKFPHLDTWNNERRAIVSAYGAALEGTTAMMATDRDGAAHLAVLRSNRRDALREHLAIAGIDSDVHYPILDPDQPSQHDLPMRRESLAESDRAREEILTLPSYPGMPSSYVDRVVEALHSFRGGEE